MAQELLHDPKIGAAFEQVGGRAVAEAVRTNVGGVRDAACGAVDDITDLSRVDPSPATTEEYRRTTGLARQRRPNVEPRHERCPSGPPEGDHTLFAALTQDPKDSEGHVEIINVHGHELADRTGVDEAEIGRASCRERVKSHV